jgi:hypothetical protein
MNSTNAICQIVAPEMVRTYKISVGLIGLARHSKNERAPAQRRRRDKTLADYRRLHGRELQGPFSLLSKAAAGLEQQLLGIPFF